jgi:tetratricopeptide (TPR) repeat protein
LAAAVSFAGNVWSDSVIVSNVNDPYNGEADTTESGKILKITRDELTLEDKAGLSINIATNRIVETHFTDEPINLQVARSAIDAAQFEDALRKIAEIPKAELESAAEPVRQDIDFYRAQASGLLALSGHPEMTLRRGGARLNDFVRNNAQSWHYYEANRLLGRILIAMEDTKNAKLYYENLCGAPWPETKAEGNIALANLLLIEGNIDDAEKAYNEVMAVDEVPGVDRQKNFARVGLAKIASFRKDHGASKALFQEVIDKSDPGDTELQAALYNAMGEAAERAGDPKAAITAYLHVDLLYSTVPTEHIAALRCLVKLWKQQLREDRAAEAQTILRERYKINN